MQIYFFFISFLSILGLFSQNAVQKAVNNFHNDFLIKNSEMSFLAIDLEKDSIIAELNSNNAIPCASITKLFTTATAIEVLGKDKKTTTRIYHSGSINSEGILSGDIWIRGGGDVSLGSKFFSSENSELAFIQFWVDSIKKKGIKRIRGSIIADGSEFGYSGCPSGWHPSDIGNYYGAFACGLNFYDNTIKFYFRTGKIGSKTEIIDIFPFVPGLVVSNEVIAAKRIKDDSYIYGLPYSMNRKIIGSLPENREIFVVKGSMPDPELLLANELVSKLKANGIEVEGDAKTVRLNENLKPNYEADLKFVFSHPSRSIHEIAYWTNVKSVNLFAEGLLNLLGYFKSGQGTTKNGLGVVLDFWKDKINTIDLVINDGSGLSRNNAISAQHFCRLLKYMSNSSNFNVFKSTLPIAGKNGTISTLCKGGSAEGRVYAKSGTFKNTKSYAGYIDSKSGKKIAFSIIVNDFKCSSSAITNRLEVILNELAEY